MPQNDNEKRQPDVFISYSSVNKNVADALVSDFEQHGIRCWYAPRDIMPGQEWVTAINDAIKACRLFILVYTSNSNESKQVANEVALAFNSGKTLVPFRLSEDEMSPELEYYLTRVHWMNAVDLPLEKNIEKLREYSEKIICGAGTEVLAHETGNEKGKKKLPKWKIAAGVLAVSAMVLCLLIIVTGQDKSSTASDKSSAGSEEIPTVIENTAAPAVTAVPTVTAVPAEKESGDEKGEDIKEIYELAYKYQMGEEGGKKPLTAYEYYMKTGDVPTESKAISEAIYKLGNQFCNGEGVEQDYEKGISLYRKAISSGNTSAMNMMGNLYLNGDGVDEDYEKAEKYYRMAADLGDETGRKNLEYISQLKDEAS